MQRCTQLHRQLVAELEQHPNQEEVKPLLGYAHTSTHYAEVHRDIVAKWVGDELMLVFIWLKDVRLVEVVSSLLLYALMDSWVCNERCLESSTSGE